MAVPPPIENFGGNVTLHPQAFAAPATEEEVLQLLAQHRGRRIRVIGRLHSWSEAPGGNDVVLDLRRLDHVRTEARDGRVWATVGAGCQIKRLLGELERQADVTLPSLGLITEQAIAGAISTGTHGSGKHSLSHYMAEVRVASYDPASGEPVMRTYASGDELRAARCSLGCLGVIVSVGFWCRPSYIVEEHWAKHDTLTGVLACEEEFPIQQFYLIPWVWKFWVQLRRETPQPRSQLAGLYRWYMFLAIDVGLHLFVLLLTRWLRVGGFTRAFFRWIVPWTVIRGWTVCDRSQDMLIIEHELFRHLEMELFVTRSQLATALEWTAAWTRHCAGETAALSETQRAHLQPWGLWDAASAARGVYTHAYPICVRKVLPDDTLISMAAGSDEPCYAISLVTCERPAQRTEFFQFADLLFQILFRACAARPHWGKWNPITAEQATAAYQQLGTFRDVCTQHDPHGVFQNDWTERVLFGGKANEPQNGRVRSAADGPASD